MKFIASLVVGVCLFVTGVAHAQPAPIAESFDRHRSVLSCPDAGSRHDYEHCAFEFMRRVACDHQSDIALWPKNGGTFCTHEGRGYDCDKLVVRASGEMFDVVASAGIASQAPTWNRVATGVFAGTVPPPSCSAGPESVDLGTAANQVAAVFHVKHNRELTGEEVNLFAAWAHELGWDGGNRIQKHVVTELVKRAQRYSGNIADPFPTISPEEALARLNARWQARFQRDVHPIELNLIIEYARTQWDGQGGVPEWLIADILLLSDQYDGSLVAAHPDSVDPASEVAFDGGVMTLASEPRHWDGATAFILQYDWFHDRNRYEMFVGGMEAAEVKTLRVGITVGTGYLILEPRSGGTFGQGRTRSLYPGDGVFSWAGYRAMLLDLLRRGFIVEVVPFLTAGAYNPGVCGARANTDTSVPQSLSAAARMAYLEEVVRELQSIRALTIEIANEYLFIGFCSDGIEVNQLAIRYKQLDPLRKVTTSAYHPSWGDYRTMHIDRHTTPHSWSWIVEQLRFPRPGVFTANDEGINGDSSGEFGNDPTPANHWANGVLSRLIPGWGYTFHYDRALKGLPPAAHDGSLQAITAWRDGKRMVPDVVQGEYYALRGALGADAAVARINGNEGWLLLIGSTSGSVDVPEWNEILIGAAGPHRLYKLSR